MLELKKNSVVMASAIFLPNTGGWVNGFITRRNIEGFYNNLNLPSWRPPNWLFGPVWTSLYCSMGYASYLVWKEGGGVNSRTYLPLTLYASQLALNWAWSPVFFQMHKLKASVYVIGALTTTATLTAITFGRISPLAGLLFVPYLAWLSFATYLNYTIYKDNRIEDITEEKKEEMKID